MSAEFVDLNPDMNWTFSSYVRAGDFIFVSHRSGLYDESGNMLKGIEAQTEQCLNALAKTLKRAGSSIDEVVKTTVLLRNLDDFKPMREVYRSFFKKGYPARITLFTDFLDEELLIQIEAIAYSPIKSSPQNSRLKSSNNIRF